MYYANGKIFIIKFKTSTIQHEVVVKYVVT
jgi:hypothetical protein